MESGVSIFLHSPVRLPDKIIAPFGPMGNVRSVFAHMALAVECKCLHEVVALCCIKVFVCQAICAVHQKDKVFPDHAKALMVVTVYKVLLVQVPGGVE